MATKPGRVVTYNEDLTSIKSHKLVFMWSSNSDFSLQFVGLERKRLSCHRLLVFIETV